MRRAAVVLGPVAVAAALLVSAGEEGDRRAAPAASDRPAANAARRPAQRARRSRGAVEREIGRSAQGRPIRAVRIGSAHARVKLLAVGSIHGNEPAGRAVIARLRRARPPRGTALWLVADLNPDGTAAGTRQNARGVDLNRNFARDWAPRGRPFDTYHSGGAPLSEPESRAAAALIRRVRPRATLWYHQALAVVVAGAGDEALERLYAARSGLPRRRLPRYPGTSVAWQSHAFPGDTPFVVELPAGPLGATGVENHARAALALVRTLARPDPRGPRGAR